MIPVEGNKNLFRDENSGAIINCDTFGHSQYIKMRDKRKQQKEEIEELKSELSEIKMLLKEIIDGKN